MSSSIHFRFKSARQFETLSFDGDFLKVADLKLAIVERKKLNFGEGFDLEIKDASTNDVFHDESALVQKNTSVIVSRIPGVKQGGILSQQEMAGKNERYAEKQNNKSSDPTSAIQRAQESSLPKTIEGADEADRISSLIMQSSVQIDRSAVPNRGRYRGGYRGNRGGNYGARHGNSHDGNSRYNNPNSAPKPSSNYVCHRCNKPGHWINQCPTNGDPTYDRIKVRPPTGIPRSMLRQVDAPESGTGLQDSSGHFVTLQPNEEEFARQTVGLRLSQAAAASMKNPNEKQLTDPQNPNAEASIDPNPEKPAENGDQLEYTDKGNKNEENLATDATENEENKNESTTIADHKDSSENTKQNTDNKPNGNVKDSNQIISQPRFDDKLDTRGGNHRQNTRNNNSSKTHPTNGPMATPNVGNGAPPMPVPPGFPPLGLPLPPPGMPPIPPHILMAMAMAHGNNSMPPPPGFPGNMPMHFPPPGMNEDAPNQLNDGNVKSDDKEGTPNDVPSDMPENETNNRDALDGHNESPAGTRSDHDRPQSPRSSRESPLSDERIGKNGLDGKKEKTGYNLDHSNNDRLDSPRIAKSNSFSSPDGAGDRGQRDDYRVRSSPDNHIGIPSERQNSDEKQFPPRGRIRSRSPYSRRSPRRSPLRDSRRSPRRRGYMLDEERFNSDRLNPRDDHRRSERDRREMQRDAGRDYSPRNSRDMKRTNRLHSPNNVSPREHLRHRTRSPSLDRRRTGPGSRASPYHSPRSRSPIGRRYGRSPRAQRRGAGSNDVRERERDMIQRSPPRRHDGSRRRRYRSRSPSPYFTPGNRRMDNSRPRSHKRARSSRTPPRRDGSRGYGDNRSPSKRNRSRREGRKEDRRDSRRDDSRRDGRWEDKPGDRRQEKRNGRKDITKEERRKDGNRESRRDDRTENRRAGRRESPPKEIQQDNRVDEGAADAKPENLPKRLENPALDRELPSKKAGRTSPKGGNENKRRTDGHKRRDRDRDRPSEKNRSNKRARSEKHDRSGSNREDRLSVHHRLGAPPGDRKRGQRRSVHDRLG